ncbi:hypothetical protein FH972_020987 [Carpinus fangiana]|uniref:Uncharacterized protein n=1 Tax=Carpinus fangiana TaxID=176857 RepID=A0A5N6KNE4_9ROSI|nr:hypothetical protein FH972_020987 [Carpinus fangiana]
MIILYIRAPPAPLITKTSNSPTPQIVRMFWLHVNNSLKVHQRTRQTFEPNVFGAVEQVISLLG